MLAGKAASRQDPVAGCCEHAILLGTSGSMDRVRTEHYLDLTERKCSKVRSVALAERLTALCAPV